MQKFERVLLLAPHGDDEALGAGGLLALLAAQGSRIHVVFGAVDGSSHHGYSGQTTLQQRIEEIDAAAACLGFSQEILYPGCNMLERMDTVAQRDLVDAFEARLAEHRPDLLLLPCGRDYDQDHRAMFDAALAATRPMPAAIGKFLAPRVLTYESPKLGWAAPFHPRMHWCIDSVIDTKLQALRCYGSQWREAPHVRSEASVRALAQLRGSEIGVQYAEAYDVLRWVH